MIEPPVFSRQPRTSASRLSMETIKERLDVKRFARKEVVRGLLVDDAEYPDFNAVWVPVPVGEDACFFVTPDYISIGSDSDFLRARTDPVTAETILQSWDAVLPTRKMVHQIYAAAPQKLPAETWGPSYDDSMMSFERWPIHDARILKGFTRRNYQQGVLTAGHMKDVVMGKGCVDRKGADVGICGWFREDGSEIQGPCEQIDPVSKQKTGRMDDAQWRAHEYTYEDYSHGFRGVYYLMWLKGEWVPLETVWAGDDYKLVSEYRFSPGSYRAVQAMHSGR